MRRFAFDAIDPSGARQYGTELATNEGDLDRQLSQRGLVLLTSRKVRARGRVTPRTVIDVFYHLSVILGAGIPVLRGLQDLQEMGEHPLAAELSDIERRVETGTSLSDALSAHPQHFPPLAVSVVRAGEQTGRLAGILSDLVSYLEWRAELRRQIRSAATYPIIVLTATLALCCVLGFFVLPRFSEIFGELGVELPGPMLVVLAMRQLLITHWLWFLGLCVALGIPFFLWQRTESARALRHRLFLRVPVFGPLILNLDLARFCHNLALFYSAGLPILDGLKMTEEIVQNRAVRRSIRHATDRLQAGSGLRDALLPEKAFPPLVLRMLHVGESTGHLDEALDHVAKFYNREVPVAIGRVIASFNVGIMVFMGATVTTVILSFFVPLYKMLGNLNAV